MLISTRTGKKRLVTLLGSVAMMVVLGVAVIGPPMALAQATRTWVSGVGDDANPCSRTAPCKTFAGAISKTAAGGEINCVDPGGFGGVTITKSMVIDCEDVHAGVLVSGTNAIIINAGVNDVVHIRGLDIEGLGTGLNGIKFLAGAALHIEHTTIRDFRGAGVGNGNAVHVANTSVGAEVTITDSEFTDNGATPNGGGVRIAPTSGGSANVLLTSVTLANNTHGVFADGAGNSGVKATIHDSSATGATNAGFAAVTPGGGGAITLMIDDSQASYNTGAGINATGTGAIVRISRCLITGNGTGTTPSGGGVIESYQTNEIRGNTSDGTRTNITSE